MKKIKLGGKRGIGKLALVDDKDFNKLSQYSWHVDNYGYPRTPTRDNKNCKMIMKRMHKMILRQKGMITDHINGNTLDNQRKNLRIVNSQQSSFNRKVEIRNTSGYKGVAWNKQRDKWQAKIEFNNKKIYLGFFKDKLQAAVAYDQAVLEYFGEFARTNIL